MSNGTRKLASQASEIVMAIFVLYMVSANISLNNSHQYTNHGLVANLNIIACLICLHFDRTLTKKNISSWATRLWTGLFFVLGCREAWHAFKILLE